MHFLVENAKGPAYDHAVSRRAQAGWDAHAAFMEALVEEGFITLGGPIGEGDGENTLLIVEADDEDAVRERLAGDPWAGTVLHLVSIRPWQIWLRG